MNDPTPQDFKVPHLFVYRNYELFDSDESKNEPVLALFLFALEVDIEFPSP